MTIPVRIEQLAATMSRFGSAQLLTLAADGAVRVHTVDPRFAHEQLHLTSEHRSALDNIARDPRVTLVWASPKHHGWTLIVDGTATVNGDAIVVEIDHGILHRPGSHDDGPEWVFPR